jgi:membrane protein YqaA with SNARE-associated domain
MKVLKFESTKEKAIFVFSLLASISTVLFTILFPFNDEKLQNLGLLGIWLTSFLSAAATFLPGFVVFTNFYVGQFYPLILVAMIIAFGSLIGDLFAYLFGYGAKTGLHQYKRYNSIENTYKRRPNLFTFVWVIFPLNPFYDVLLALAGTSGMRLRNFIVIIFVGRFIRSLYIATIGSALLA